MREVLSAFFVLYFHNIFIIFIIIHIMTGCKLCPQHYVFCFDTAILKWYKIIFLAAWGLKLVPCWHASKRKIKAPPALDIKACQNPCGLIQEMLLKQETKCWHNKTFCFRWAQANSFPFVDPFRTALVLTDVLAKPCIISEFVHSHCSESYKSAM